MLLKSVLILMKSRSSLHSSKNIRFIRQKMQNAYLRYQDGDEQFQLSFQLKNETLRLNRQFNFSRQLSEKVSDFLGRVSTNIERVVNKKKKRRKDVSEEESKIEVILLRDGEQVHGDEVCKDVLFNNDLFLHVLDSEFSVIFNAPWVNLITLPVSIMTGFPVYPVKLEIMFADQADCCFSWYKNTSITALKNAPADWVEVGSGYFYTPSASDIGCRLKVVCTPRNRNKEGPSLEVISTNPVEAGPGACPFELRHSFTNKRLMGKKFRVVTYNILAELYADSDVARTQLFPYCPPYAINIDYRKQLILKELLGYNADLICLQEVDSKVFSHDLIPTLSSVGYNGVFSKKSGEVSEGLACFFHESRFKSLTGLWHMLLSRSVGAFLWQWDSCFPTMLNIGECQEHKEILNQLYRLVASHNIHLSEELQSNPLFFGLWNKIKDNKALADRITQRTTCSQFVVLDSVDNSKEKIVVANTHQYFHPDADHIRLLQVGMTLTYLEHLVAETVAGDKEKRVSCIFCGDFNSTPEWGVYRLITTQHVPEDCRDWSSNKDEEVKNVSLSHSLQLTSACGTPEFTNYTVGFVGCLDYIFYQHDHLDVVQVVPLPSNEEVQEHVALPSVVFPSDHISLVADLSWK